MKLRLSCLAIAFAASLTGAWAQAPLIGYVYPAGGRQGTTFLVEAGGQGLRGTDDVCITGAGVRAEVVEYVPALGNMELRATQTFLRDLVKRQWVSRVMDAAATQTSDKYDFPDHRWLRDLDGKSPGELQRLWMRLFDPKKQPNAQIAEGVVFEVTIDPDAPPGDRELRLATPTGLSSPMRFQVGTLPEAREENAAGYDDATTPALDLPVLLNGQIMPGDVDRFRFRAQAGQQLVVRVQARRLLPYLADAVPGWFQATVALFDPIGREVAFNDDFRFDPDPVLGYEVPADGIYALQVRDAIYRGREDFVYRIAVGELPFITQIFPLGAREGTPATAAISGWNLPADTLQLDTSPGGDAIRLATVGANVLASEARYAVDALPETAEAEAGDGPQAVTPPIIVNGRIERPGDVDEFSFEGRAGQEIVAEVRARRLGSPLDSALRLVGPDGAEVAANDDHKDETMGLMTHHADAYLRVELPQDGTYRLALSDTQVAGGDAHAYRLRIGPAQPDFVLRVTPASLSVSGGRSAKVKIYAMRRDGFAGEIDVALAEAPEGFTLTPVRVAADADSAETTLTAPKGAPRQIVPVRLEGRAQIGGVEVTRPVVPAEDMMQAFLWWQVVPQQELLVAVTGTRPVPAVWRPILPGVALADTAPVRIPLGHTAQVRVEAPQTLADRAATPLNSIIFRMSNRPRGVTLADAAVTPTGVTLTLKADANIALPGDSANAIVEAFVEPADDAAGAGADVRRNRVSLGVLPAIAFEIVRR